MASDSGHCRKLSLVVHITIGIIIATLSLSGLASAENVCPSQCVCYVDDDNGLKTANCTGIEFVSFSDSSKLYSNLEVLNIKPHNDRLIKLNDDMFHYFVKLKQLNLSKCRIKNIPKNLFKGLKKIWEINLSDNEIQHFHSSVFENIYTLSKLSLRGNPLQISFKPFIISNNLKELDLGNCGISMLQNEFFHGLKKLNHLYLDGNYIQTIKEHVLPRGLTHLNLANNKIVNVPIDAISSLNQLRRVDLNGNFINCTCAVLNFQNRLSGRGIIIDEEVKCAFPIELENISLSKVNEKEICNKEIFIEKAHYRKSHSSKFTHPKHYFENEKYSSYESLQGDQPDGDDYQQDVSNTNEEINPENYNKKDSETTKNYGTDDKQEIKKLATQKKSTETGVRESESTAEEAEQVQADSEGTTQKSDDSSRVTTESLKNENDLSEKNTDNKGEDDETNDNKVVKSPEKSDSIPEEDKIKDEAKDNNDLEQKEDHDDVADHITKNPEIIEEIENSNSNNLANSDTKPVTEENNNSDGGTDKEVEQVLVTNSNEIHVQQGNNGHDKEKLTESTTTHSTKNRDEELYEGSGTGDTSETTLPLGESITFEPNSEDVEDDSPAYIDQNISTYESKPDAESKEYEPQTPENDEVKEGAVETHMTPLKYESMGQYIVVGGIALLVVVLLLVSICKGCKSKTTKRDPIPDIEANSGVELQDMASLLPKPQVKEEIINSKYPNEVPSNETVNLIKGNKTEDSHDPIDLNQNANKNEPLIKNGKSVTDGLGPIEVTKVKLTVLPDSVPRTPIIVQKRSATLNNGV